MDSIWIAVAVLALLLVAVARAQAGPVSVVVSSNDQGTKLQAWATAIAQAEGYFVSGSLPYVRNNPGAITNVEGVISYPDVDAGWDALYRQLSLAISGESRHYNLGMTWNQFAWIWTGGDNPEGWAATVSGRLGVNQGSAIRQWWEGA